MAAGGGKCPSAASNNRATVASASSDVSTVMVSLVVTVTASVDIGQKTLSELGFCIAAALARTIVARLGWLIPIGKRAMTKSRCANNQFFGVQQHERTAPGAYNSTS